MSVRNYKQRWTRCLAAAALAAGLASQTSSADAQQVRLTDAHTFVNGRAMQLQSDDLPLADPSVPPPPPGALPGSAPAPLPGEVIGPEADFTIPSAAMGADCGFGCPDRWYAMAEGVFLAREEGDSFALTNFGDVGDFDYEPGGRFTIGRTYDCLDGWEVSYTGPFRWETGQTVAFANSLSARFLPGNLIDPNALDTFYNADVQSQFYTSDLHVAEAYRRWWGWDVFSLKVGGKYVNLEEGYELLSLDNGRLGQMIVEGENHLAMGAIGIDMMSPIGRWTFGTKITGALGVTFNEGTLVVVNDGNPVVARRDSSEDFAAMVDGGFYAIYRLSEHISLHAGYEAWYMYGLNIPSEQDYQFINFDSGESFDEKGDLLFHGATAGVEIVW